MLPKQHSNFLPLMNHYGIKRLGGRGLYILQRDVIQVKNDSWSEMLWDFCGAMKKVASLYKVPW